MTIDLYFVGDPDVFVITPNIALVGDEADDGSSRQGVALQFSWLFWHAGILVEYGN